MVMEPKKTLDDAALPAYITIFTKLFEAIFIYDLVIVAAITWELQMITADYEGG